MTSPSLAMPPAAPISSFGFEKSVRVRAHFAVYPARHAQRAPVEAFLAWLHGEAARAATTALRRMKT